MTSAVDAFLEQLRNFPPGNGIGNPWAQYQADDSGFNGPEMRRERLREYLSGGASFALIGEGLSYQGGRITGLPFSSERLVLAGEISRVPKERQRLSTRTKPWSEPSATIVWKALRDLKLNHTTVMWNSAFFHPHIPGVVESNRTPSRSERQMCAGVLRDFIALFPEARVAAVGQTASKALSEIGMTGFRTLRHPAYGGGPEFRKQLEALAAEGIAHQPAAEIQPIMGG